ncbi:MAG: serine acetyltransferase [Cyclobacteriaceae bacterium]|nr:serine acetyltransferase [Cyclobacteriaceae bacterium]
MNKDFIKNIYKSHVACPKCPSPARVSAFFNELLGTLFPDFAQMEFTSEKELELHLGRLQLQLDQIFTRSPGACSKDPEKYAGEFFDALPAIHSKLMDDVKAMFEGDPAAKTEREVIRTYPGFYAIAAYRIAHKLHELGVVIVPRIITEHAHGKTGIDIHPAAKIGEHFCIDHGTGVVIGETTVIGNRVKIYQGVTLGALSVNKEDAIKKRHPTIEEDVVLYAGATILGGETVIGKGSIIGGNVWIIKSVPAGSRIYYQSRMYNANTEETDQLIYKH